MLSFKLRAIILKRSNFGEADKFLTVFSLEKGKISLLAKGIRRIKSHRAPHLEPLNEVEIVTHKNIITQAKISSLNTFNLQNLTFALYGAEILDKLLPENEPHEEIYELFRNFLSEEIAENKVKEFSLKTLWLLGYLPPGQFPKIGINAFIEHLAERRIRSKKLIEEI